MLALRTILAAAFCCSLALAKSPCSSQVSPPVTCSACIQMHSSCSWCTDNAFVDKYKGPQHRCGTEAELQSRGCRRSESPKSNMTIDNDKGLSDQNQIRPQNITLQMRTHQPQSFEFEFKQAENYPVDLYILSDKSHSMHDFLQAVANMSERIQNTLQDLTRNWRIGVGFFVDKPVFPYVQPNQGKVPCGELASDERCINTFSYIHAMHLSQNTSILKSVTADKSISANLDAPEGALDALLMSIICRRQIGWRDNSRKVVLLAVDGGFHMAGDGRFGGIVEPFPEGICQLQKGANTFGMTGTLEYKNATLYDYPSIGQVAKVLTDNKVSIIFALKQELFMPMYLQLQKALPVVTEVDLIKTGEVVKLIRKNYKSIAETVKIRVNNPGSHLNVTIQVLCPGQTEFKDGDACKAVTLGATVKYRVTLTLTKCLMRDKELVSFTSSTSEDKLTVRIQSLCKCPVCEAKGDRSVKVQNCSGKGYIECGVCKCDDGFRGDTCNCRKTEEEDQCRQEKTNLICSGRGRCVCNKCICSSSQYTGKKCDKDMLSCPRAWTNQKVCGGPAQGVCDGKGKCNCLEGFSHSDCSCNKKSLNDPNACRSSKPEYKDVDCAGHGTCICGRCVCEALWASDPKCDTKAGSTGSLCNDNGLQKCVRCVFENRKLPPESRQKSCECSFSEEKINIDESDIKLTTQKEVVDGKSTCVLALEDDCQLLFGYQLNKDYGASRNISLFVQNEQQCRERVSVLALVLIVVAAVVLIGLAILLIWRLLMTISDRREFAKFKRLQQENSRWGAGENPIYKGPDNTVHNPIFEGRVAS